MQMKVNLDRTHIRNFLTLRYNPLQNTTRSLANAKGFSTGNSDPDGKLVEKLLLASVNKLTKDTCENIIKAIIPLLKSQILSYIIENIIEKSFD